MNNGVSTLQDLLNFTAQNTYILDKDGIVKPLKYYIGEKMRNESFLYYNDFKTEGNYIISSNNWSTG